MSSFDTKTRSRDDSAPVNLFVFSGNEDVENQLENLMRSVCLIPGTTEFGYGTTVIRKTEGADTFFPTENAIVGGLVTDYTRAIQQLIDRAPNLKHVSLVVAWHGSDLRIGECEIKPKVDPVISVADGGTGLQKVTTPYSWQVGSVTRATAEEVSTYLEDGKHYPGAGGAPADRTVWECVTDLKARGIAVTVYPFILMDVPEDNSLPNPYGSGTQPAFPWRGRITCDPAPGRSGSPDQTAAAATQVDAFFGTVTPSDFGWDATNKVVTYSGPANEWSFRRHILHIATIAAAAGADDILIGTEMVGMTTIRSSATSYPAVDNLIALAADVRSIVGSGMKISYAADWSEYHSHRPSDGTNDINYNMDPLWADSNIDYIGIDNYLPTSDWRDGFDHLDAQQGWNTIYDRDYMRSNIEGGEYYDWYYASSSDRENQVRTPIQDGARVLDPMTIQEIKAPGQEPDFMDDYTQGTYTFHGEVVFPNTAQDAALATHAGADYRLWLGVTGGGATMRLRAGSGLGSLTDSNTDTAVLNVPTSGLPFDGNLHSVTWEVRPNPGRVRLWVDGYFRGEASTTGGGPLQTESFTGWGNGTWTEDADGDGHPDNTYAGAPFVPAEPDTDWPTLTNRSNLTVFDGEANYSSIGTSFVFQQKNIRDWWRSNHYPRTSNVPGPVPTVWVPESKPIVFTELGCSALNKGSNQPNVFIDPKSSESFFPHHSNGLRDDLVQRIYLESWITYWQENNPDAAGYSGKMLDLDKLSLWAWDARPFPEFPKRDDYWGDAPNWEVGHWLNGRIARPIDVFGTTADYRYTDAVREISFGGHVYKPLPIGPGKNRLEGNIPNTQFEVKVPRDSELAALFHSFRPAHPISLTILQGHLTDSSGVFTPRWSGKVISTKRNGAHVVIHAQPFSAAIHRTGLRKNYQIGCPHILYGRECRASKAAATDTGTVASANGAKIVMNAGWTSRDVAKFVGGIAEWTTSAGTIERRRILNVADDEVTVSLSGAVRGLDAGGTVKLSLGCDHTVADCLNLHNNIPNYGGCITIPVQNPIDGTTNNFY